MMKISSAIPGLIIHRAREGITQKRWLKFA